MRSRDCSSTGISGARMSVEGERIRARDGRSVAADLIEEMAVRNHTRR